MEETHICLFLLVICACARGNVLLQYEVTEEDIVGQFIGNIAIDGGLRSNFSNEEFNNLRFSLLPQRNSYFGLFDIDERIGILTTAARLDRENICGQTQICILNVSVATLSTTTDFFSVLNISILLKDRNDNSPVFPTTNMQVSFSESAKVGDSFQIQPAVDQDIGINADITYQLQGSDGTFGLQHDINQNGISDLRIVVNRLLDHETSQQQQLTLIARDGGLQSNIATASITIKITDINDHIPVFTETTYIERILENTPVSTTLLQVSARDLDKGVNGKITYNFPTLTSNAIREVFFLNSTTGELVLQKALNFAAEQSYTFQIEGRDGGSPAKQALTTVAITVVDVNDNAPSISFKIPGGEKSLTVSESLNTGDFITRMSVYDRDGGKGGQVTCTLTGNRFQLVHIFGSEFKILLNSTLNREIEPMINLTVTCTDMGSPPQQDVKTLTINLRDVNDVKPKFTQDWYYSELTENSPNGDVVTTVKAEDGDLGESGRVSYKINATGRQYFQVLNNGDIIVSSTVDRETKAEIVFEVIAMDNTSPFHSSTATVQVTILDLNDEAPDFGMAEKELRVFENMPAGSTVGVVLAEDHDLGAGGLVSYSIPAEDSTLPFLVDDSSGEITTTQSLNREDQDVYEVSILATDKGTPQQTSTLILIIFVEDKNDNKPVFNFPNENNNTVMIYNTHKLGGLVTKVRATDSDKKNNSRLVYTFQRSGPPYDIFSLDPLTGDISLSKPLSNRGKQTLELVIVVSDHGEPKMSSTMRLFITVSLDNRPLPIPDGLAGRTNLTIAICILAVSAIVSGTIVVVICLVKRRSNKQTEDNTKKLPPGKSANSLYDIKKNPSADIIITRDGTHKLYTTPTVKDDDVMIKYPDASNPTFQIFPTQDHYPKMGYTEDPLGKSDGQSNSSTGDSGRGLSQDDIQWLHQHQDFEHLHCLEEEDYSQSSVPSHDDHLPGDYRWHPPHYPQAVQSSPSAHSAYHIGSPHITSDYNSTFS